MLTRAAGAPPCRTLYCEHYTSLCRPPPAAADCSVDGELQRAPDQHQVDGRHRELVHDEVVAGEEETREESQQGAWAAALGPLGTWDTSTHLIGRDVCAGSWGSRAGYPRGCLRHRTRHCHWGNLVF